MAASLDSNQTNTSDAGPDARARLSALPAGQLWHSSAPAALRTAWKSDPHGDGWKRLRKLLAGRALPKSLQPKGKKRPPALQWGAPASLASSPGLLKNPESSIEEWVDRCDHRQADPKFVLECLAWAGQLPAVAQQVESEVWWRLAEQLVEIAQQTMQVSLGEEPTADKAYAQQALGGELPLMLSQLIPELLPLRGLRKPAATVLTEGVLALTDGEGMPTARVLPRLPLLAASWTRCRAWAEYSGKRCWDDDAETQYEWLVRQSLRLCRPNGALALCDDNKTMGDDAVGDDVVGSAALLDVALDLAGDVSDHAAAAKRLGKKAYREVAGKAAAPEPSANSEWSGIAVLASGWSPQAQRAIVTYEGRQSNLEYSAGGKTLFSGAWTTEVTVDGKTLTPVEDWEEQCWFSDDDCDYLELSLKLEGGAQLDRQVLVTREDKIAYLADTVLTGKQQDCKIAVTMRLPLASGARFDPSQETREGWLAVDKAQVAGVMPAALPEWRTDPRIGSLTEADGSLVLRQEWTGRNVCLPLFLDASPSRFKKQRTWRQLTVAQALHPVPRDVAVGYRFQSGNDQWIAYRSLDKPANRTLIGHNLASEGLFGRFLKTGEVDEYFEIEDD